MPFAAPKPKFQGNLPPQPTTLPYDIKTTRLPVIATSLLTTAAAITMKAGDTVTATVQQTGTGPGGSAYPRIQVDTYMFQRNGQANDALGASFTTFQNLPRNTPMIFRMTVTNSASALVGQSAAILVNFRP